MIKKLIIITSVLLVFFFGEIALTFSDKGYPSLFEDEEVAFSLKLENEFSDMPETASIDKVVNSFIKKWRINGASVAVTNGEELIYAKGFGYADKENKEEVIPGHLFRIASVSKLITAVAIMKLYEEGQLNLDDYVFGLDGILDTDMFPEYKDPRYEKIKVQHLLNHTSGWSQRSADPMFSSLYIARKMDIEPPLHIDHIIDYALSRKLNYEPGTRYSYSNLGYAILGRIIEEKSGITYEDYVMMNVLKPMGIHDMHIGRTYHHQKFPNEVKYYATGKTRRAYSIDGSGEYVPVYYGGNNIELLGPAGGWVSSAPELIKFLTAIDGFSAQPDILKEETIQMMTDPNQAGKGLFGWRGNDSRGTWWRTGYFYGSSALMVRQSDGLNWVILTNTSTYKQSRIHSYVSGMMFGAVNRVNDWPQQDLFMVDQDAPEPINNIPVNNPKL
jgi:CubicO group peptidase (beta-lactamase class C family)